MLNYYIGFVNNSMLKHAKYQKINQIRVGEKVSTYSHFVQKSLSTIKK